MKTILVPVDFSDVSPRLLETAARFATAFGSRVILLHVAEPQPDFVGFEPGPFAVPPVAVVPDFAAERARLVELGRAAGLGDAETLHVHGPAVDEILRQAAEHSAELIVMGSHGHGAFFELLVGSITHGVLKGARCPVLVVPAEARVATAAAE